IGGALMTIVPMIVGFFLSKYLMKLPLLNSLGSITGGMTSTPALGTLINTAKTEDVASAYASTYPIALVLVVLACQLMITLL
ncbi:MAG: permease, partial [Clostridia bacterium]|nr:permease [Clostridia bacterium]